MNMRQMKDLRYIYENSTNPIDNSNINKIIGAYLRDGKFYRNLVRVNTGRQVEPDYRDIDKFESFLFNTWKNNVINYRSNDNDPRNNFLYDPDFINLRNTLYNIGDVRSAAEMLQVMDRLNYDSNTEYGVKKYGPMANNFNDYWRHIMSRRINVDRGSDLDFIEHRIYINIGREVEYDFLQNMVEKFNDKNLPYYFKYSNRKNCSRDDGVVIYSDTKHLPLYIEALNEIKEEHFEYNPYIGKPPVLSCVVDGWLGYGSEPLNDGDKRLSFNEKRQSILEEAIKNGTRKWIYQNFNMEIEVNGKTMTYKEYLVNILTDKAVQDLREKAELLTENDQKIVRKFDSPVFRDLVFKRYNNNIDKMMREIIDTGICSKESDIVVLVNGKNISTQNNTLMDGIFYNEMQYYNTVDQGYRDFIGREIFARCRENDIDPNNFGFDLHISDTIEKEKTLYKSIPVSKVKSYFKGLLSSDNHEVEKMFDENESVDYSSKKSYK